MLHVNIGRPTTADLEQLNDFFRTVIIDTFIKEGIGDQLNDINEEIEVKKRYLTSDFESNGKERYFLIAFYGDKILDPLNLAQQMKS